jgi:hypothetical protein
MMRLFGKERWSLEALDAPWADLKSIYDHIRGGVSR